MFYLHSHNRNVAKLKVPSFGTNSEEPEYIKSLESHINSLQIDTWTCT